LCIVEAFDGRQHVLFRINLDTKQAFEYSLADTKVIFIRYVHPITLLHIKGPGKVLRFHPDDGAS